MKPIVVYAKKNDIGNILLTPDELENLIDAAYKQGLADGKNNIVDQGIQNFPALFCSDLVATEDQK